MNLRRSLCTMIVTMAVMHALVMILHMSKPKKIPEVPLVAYVVKSPEYGDSLLPTSFRTYLTSNNIDLKDIYTMGTNMIFCRNHVIMDHALRKVTPYTRLVYGMIHTDLIACKRSLANAIRHTPFMPSTSVLALSTEDRLKQFTEAEMNVPCIFKENIQQQMGLTITTNKDEFVRALENTRNVVCQEILINPLLINSRKVNMRVYVLLLYVPPKSILGPVDFVKKYMSSNECDYTGHFEVHVYSDGFMYYTKQPFLREPMSKLYERDNLITTGYIDRQVYIDNPLTIEDLHKFLGEESFRKLHSNIMESIRVLFRSNYVKNIFQQEAKRLQKTKRFIIMGCDIAPDDQYGAKIMEINKGPDLTGKDDRDTVLKEHMVKTFMDYILKGSTSEHLLCICDKICG